MKAYASVRRFSAKQQRGAVAVLMAVCLFIMVAMLAIADVGFMYTTKREFQKTADLAAMAGARALVGSSGNRDCGAARSAAKENARINLTQPLFPALDVENTGNLEVLCGEWAPSAAGGSPFISGLADNAASLNAVRVTVVGKPHGFFMPALFGNQPREISADATSTLKSPQAQLKIRSTLVSLEDGAVNALLGSLLGSNVALDVVGWQGIVNADINLLHFFNDLLAIDVAADIGTYQGLLDRTDITLGKVLDAMIHVAKPASDTAILDIQVLEDLKAITSLGGLHIPLGDILDLQTGTETAGLDTTINAFDLVRAVAQVANGANAIDLSVPINIGVAGVSIQAKVIDPPQASAIGNPELINPVNAKAGTNNIYVRTGQIRVLVSVDLNVIGLVNKLLEILKVLGGTITVADNKLHIALGVGEAEGWVTNYACGNTDNKSMNAESQTSAALVSIGKLTPAQEEAVFSSSSPFPSATPLNILSVKLGVLGLIGATDVAKVSLAAAAPSILGAGKSFVYSATNSAPDELPEIHAEDTLAMYKQLSAQDPLSSVNSAVANLNLKLEVLPGSLVGTILSLLGVTNLINNILAPLVSAVVGNVLAPLLDPILNNLFDTLGLNLAEADLGAKLSCSSGAVLIN